MSKKDLREKLSNQLKDNKKIYKLNKQKIKNQYISDLTEYINNNPKQVVNPPYRHVLEEIGNAVTHGVGSLFAVAAFLLMLLASDSFADKFSTYIYGIGMIILFTMSCLYHAFPYGSTVKRIFRRFDYSSIYLLIGATYTPILLSYLGGVKGIVFCAIQWAIICTGITFIGIFGPAKLKWLHMPLYFILGWCGIIFLPYMIQHDFILFLYILGGGIVYCLGIIPFAMNKKVSHFIWHFFVLAGAIVQWLGIYFYIYL